MQIELVYFCNLLSLSEVSFEIFLGMYKEELRSVLCRKNLKRGEIWIQSVASSAAATVNGFDTLRAILRQQKKLR